MTDRKHGTPNKASAADKVSIENLLEKLGSEDFLFEASAADKVSIENVFEKLGGEDFLVKWARENPTEFFKLWVKVLLPQA